jgi:hypothetical protein
MARLGTFLARAPFFRRRDELRLLLESAVSTIWRARIAPRSRPRTRSVRTAESCVFLAAWTASTVMVVIVYPNHLLTDLAMPGCRRVPPVSVPLRVGRRRHPGGDRWHDRDEPRPPQHAVGGHRPNRGRPSNEPRAARTRATGLSRSVWPSPAGTPRRAPGPLRRSGGRGLARRSRSPPPGRGARRPL